MSTKPEALSGCGAKYDRPTHCPLCERNHGGSSSLSDGAVKVEIDAIRISERGDLIADKLQVAFDRLRAENTAQAELLENAKQAIAFVKITRRRYPASMKKL